MYTLIIPPDKAGYTVADGTEVIRTQLDGGAGRYRRDILNAASRVTVQWSTGRDGYEYLRSFYNVTVGGSSNVFTIMLLMDKPWLTEHQAYFVPGTMRLSEVAGFRHVVTAELEVLNEDDEIPYDEALVTLIGAYGNNDAAIEHINILEQLANYDLPRYS